MAKVFVGGKWENREVVRKFMDRLVAEGHTITHDWTKNEETTYRAELAIQALGDLDGVREADFSVFIVEDDKVIYRGVLVEMGAALAWGQRVYLLGEAQDSNIYSNHPNVTTLKNTDAWRAFLGR